MAALVPALALAGTNHVAMSGSDASGDGASWGTAWASISNAVAKSMAGDTVLVSNGIYSIKATVLINKALTIRGFSGNPVGTILNAGNLALGKCMILTNAPILLEALTVTNSQAYGIYLAGTGTVRNCIITGHKASWAAGVYCDRGGVVDRCIIRGNQSHYPAAGANMNYGGTVRNCLIVDNVCTWSASSTAGINLWKAPGLVENCTITRNTGAYCGGVIGSGGSVKNSIVYGNSSPLNPNYVGYGGSVPFTYTCISPLQSGVGNTNADPQFVSADGKNFSLLPTSPLLDAGSDPDWMYGATDLAGRSRISGARVDMGCYEYQLGGLDCGFSASPLAVVAPGSIAFTGSVTGTNTTTVRYSWDFADDGTFDTNGINLASVSHVYPVAGRYSVKLMVSNTVGEVSAFTRTNYITIGPATAYVARAANNPAYPYDRWDQAASNVQAAVDAAVDGSVVLVGDGRYVLTNMISIRKGVALRSVGGKTAATLDGNGAVRCLYVDHTNAVVDGFTITKGYCSGVVGAPGVYIDRGGTVRNCDIVRNRAGGNTSPGAFWIVTAHGTLSHCIVAGNAAGNYTASAGLVYYGTVRNCAIIDNTNSAPYAAALSVDNNALLESCTIAGNRVVSDGTSTAGGIRGGTARLYNCIIWSNRVVTTENNWLGNFTAATNCTTPTLGTGCITSHPRFVDTAYRISDGSSCYNRGAYRPWMEEATDLDGNRRVFRGRVDIGAYEATFYRGTVITVY